MNEYLKTWKAEHASLILLLNSPVMYSIYSKEHQDKMLEAKNMILKHLKSEDEILYPMLKKAARGKISIERMLDLFSKEMDELAPKITAFFKECENDPASDGLTAELRNIIKLLTERIRKEENILLPQFEDIIGRADNEKIS